MLLRRGQGHHGGVRGRGNAHDCWVESPQNLWHLHAPSVPFYVKHLDRLGRPGRGRGGHWRRGRRWLWWRACALLGRYEHHGVFLGLHPPKRLSGDLRQRRRRGRKHYPIVASSDVLRACVRSPSGDIGRAPITAFVGVSARKAAGVDSQPRPLYFAGHFRGSRTVFVIPPLFCFFRPSSLRKNLKGLSKNFCGVRL